MEGATQAGFTFTQIRPSMGSTSVEEIVKPQAGSAKAPGRRIVGLAKAFEDLACCSRESRNRCRSPQRSSVTLSSVASRISPAEGRLRAVNLIALPTRLAGSDRAARGRR